MTWDIVYPTPDNKQNPDYGPDEEEQERREREIEAEITRIHKNQ
jgi:hypothetical protein